MFARKNCARIAAAARVAGWSPESEYAPRQYLIVARRAQREGVPMVAGCVEAPPLFNPRICACGCGRSAKFASGACSRRADRAERPANGEEEDKKDDKNVSRERGSREDDQPKPPWEE